VKAIRPKGLPVRSLALAGTAIAANLPCGAWREHTKKFSFQWIVAVHATIPFVAMLRKAVLMPPWAVLLTVAGAMAGQQAGAVLERKRLAGGGDRAPFRGRHTGHIAQGCGVAETSIGGGREGSVVRLGVA
jgi:hypothetical protein